MSKLLIAIVHELDADNVIRGLLTDGIRATRIRSSGGFLQLDNTTLLIGVEEGAVPSAVAILERECHSREVELPLVLAGNLRDELPAKVRHGGATVFVSDLEAILHIGTDVLAEAPR